MDISKAAIAYASCLSAHDMLTREKPRLLTEVRMKSQDVESCAHRVELFLYQLH